MHSMQVETATQDACNRLYCESTPHDLFEYLKSIYVYFRKTVKLSNCTHLTFAGA